MFKGAKKWMGGAGSSSKKGDPGSAAGPAPADGLPAHPPTPPPAPQVTPAALQEMLLMEEEPGMERPRLKMASGIKGELQRIRSVTNADGTMNWMAFVERVAPMLAAEEEKEVSQGYAPPAPPRRSFGGQAPGGPPQPAPSRAADGTGAYPPPPAPAAGAYTPTMAMARMSPVPTPAPVPSQPPPQPYMQPVMAAGYGGAGPVAQAIEPLQRRSFATEAHARVTEGAAAATRTRGVAASPVYGGAASYVPEDRVSASAAPSAAAAFTPASTSRGIAMAASVPQMHSQQQAYGAAQPYSTAQPYSAAQPYGAAPPPPAMMGFGPPPGAAAAQPQPAAYAEATRPVERNLMQYTHMATTRDATRAPAAAAAPGHYPQPPAPAAPVTYPAQMPPSPPPGVFHPPPAASAAAPQGPPAPAPKMMMARTVAPPALGGPSAGAAPSAPALQTPTHQVQTRGIPRTSDELGYRGSPSYMADAEVLSEEKKGVSALSISSPLMEAEKLLSYTTTTAGSRISVVSSRSSAFQQVDESLLALLQEAAPSSDRSSVSTQPSAATTQPTGRTTSLEASQRVVVSVPEAEGAQPKVTLLSLAQQVEGVPDAAPLPLTPAPIGAGPSAGSGTGAGTRVVSPFGLMLEEGLAPQSAGVALRLNQLQQPESDGAGKDARMSTISDVSEGLTIPSSTATAGEPRSNESGVVRFFSSAADTKAHATSVSNGPLSPVTALEPTYWAIPQSDIVLTRRLGAGSYGEVWLASYHFVDVAVKLIPWCWKSLSVARFQGGQRVGSAKHEEVVQSEQELARFRQEVDFQRRLSLHPNIVPFIGACEPWSSEEESAAQRIDEDTEANSVGPKAGPKPGRPPPSDQLVIVMGYCKLGDIFNLIRKSRLVMRLLSTGRTNEAQAPSLAHASVFYQSWEKRLDVAAGAAAGLYHMHDKGVVHRDLTSYNILLDSGFSAKLADFNLSRVVPRGATNMLLTNSGSLNSPLWQPPEMLRGESFYDGKRLDVFSFGIILSEIITLWVPYTSGSEEEATALMSDMRTLWPLIGKIVGGTRPALPATRAECKPPLPSTLSADQATEVFTRLIQLTQRCWHGTPERRPTMGEVAHELRSLVNILRDARLAAAAKASYEAGLKAKMKAMAKQDYAAGAHHGVY